MQVDKQRIEAFQLKEACELIRMYGNVKLVKSFGNHYYIWPPGRRYGASLLGSGTRSELAAILSSARAIVREQGKRGIGNG